MAKIIKEDIALYETFFDMRLRHLVDHLKDYKNILLEQAVKSQSTTVIFDKDFMIELCDDGFLRCLISYHTSEVEYKAIKESIMNQVNDLLNDED